MRVFVSIFFICLTMQGQNIAVNLGDFSNVKIFSGLEVTYHESSENKLEISGNLKEYVNWKISKDMLRISMDVTKVFKDHNVKINLYLKKVPILLDLNEGVKFTLSDSFKGLYSEIKVQEGAEFHGRLALDSAKFKSITGGQIVVSGHVEDYDCYLNTGGLFDAYELSASKASIVALAGGEANVFVDKILDVEVKIGGIVNYKGVPEILETNKLLGGTINAKN